MIERVVVASDRSETAGRAVDWAAEMARRYGATLTIVHQPGVVTTIVGSLVEKNSPQARSAMNAPISARSNGRISLRTLTTLPA